MPQVKPEIETFAKILVVGVGGSGGSAVDRMVKNGIRGVEFVALNTDVQALHHCSAAEKLHIGKTITRGLGAGMNPEVGRRSAEESQNEIREILKGSDMVFITCGLGGGTGSGASPLVAAIAREMGALTVAVVTKPFSFEGPQRCEIAEKAHEELAKHVDAIITIPNDRVLQIIDKKTSLIEAFRIVDDVLRQGVQGISELITVPGQINVDFADVKTTMENTGSALMGIGVGKGDNRAIDAARAAVSSPLLELSIDGARAILLTVTGGPDLSMQEVAEAVQLITTSADDQVRVIWGNVIDPKMENEVRITVIATGFGEPKRRNLLISPLETAEEASATSSAPSLSRGFGGASSIFAKKRSPIFHREEEEETKKEDPPGLRSSFRRRDVVEEPSTSQNDERRIEDALDLDSSLSPSSSASSSRTQAAGVPNKKDDFEIPAFIRRKMRSS